MQKDTEELPIAEDFFRFFEAESPASECSALCGDAHSPCRRVGLTHHALRDHCNLSPMIETTCVTQILAKIAEQVQIAPPQRVRFLWISRCHRSSRNRRASAGSNHSSACRIVFLHGAPGDNCFAQRSVEQIVLSVVRQWIHVQTSVPEVSGNFHIFSRESGLRTLRSWIWIHRNLFNMFMVFPVLGTLLILLVLYFHADEKFHENAIRPFHSYPLFSQSENIICL